MIFFFKMITFSRVFTISLIILFLLDILSFYGIYSNKFYFLKLDNYIFPFLTIIHFTYLYLVNKRIKERKKITIKIQGLEYTMYFIFLIYIYKLFETLYVLLSYNSIYSSLLPKTFLPTGILILILYLLLIINTFLLFELRRQLLRTVYNKTTDKDIFNKL